MTEPQKAMLLKIDPLKGHFSASAIETRVLNVLKRGGLVIEKSPWKFYLTDAGHEARASIPPLIAS